MGHRQFQGNPTPKNEAGPKGLRDGGYVWTKPSPDTSTPSPAPPVPCSVMLPPENATGNYVKVVQRIPVKIILDPISPGCGCAPPGHERRSNRNHRLNEVLKLANYAAETHIETADAGWLG